MLTWQFVEILILVVIHPSRVYHPLFFQSEKFLQISSVSLLCLGDNGWYRDFYFTLSSCCTWCREQDSTENAVHHYKTLVAWFKSNLLLNIQMFNMSSLHKYYYKQF